MLEVALERAENGPVNLGATGRLREESGNSGGQILVTFFDCGGVRLFLSEGDGGPAASLLYLRVTDIHAAQTQLEQRGAQFVSAPHLIHTHADGTEEWMAFFNDNEQRPLGLMAQVAPK